MIILNVPESISCPSFSYQIAFNDWVSDDIEHINEVVQGLWQKIKPMVDSFHDWMELHMRLILKKGTWKISNVALMEMKLQKVKRITLLKVVLLFSQGDGENKSTHCLSSKLCSCFSWRRSAK